MNRSRSPRLPRNRQAPGQLTLDAALLRAQNRYPEATDWRPTRNRATVLSILPGGARPAPLPVASRKAAA